MLSTDQGISKAENKCQTYTFFGPKSPKIVTNFYVRGHFHICFTCNFPSAPSSKFQKMSYLSNIYAFLRKTDQFPRKPYFLRERVSFLYKNNFYPRILCPKTPDYNYHIKSCNYFIKFFIEFFIKISNVKIHICLTFS